MTPPTSTMMPPPTADAGTAAAEREELRAILRRLLARHGDETAAREAMSQPPAFDRGLWSELVELGVPGLVVPASAGGAGATWADAALVAEELGRVLAPVPFLSTVGLALPILLEADAADDVLTAVANGEATLALAAGLDARPAGDGFLLDGQARFVVDGLTAEMLVVVASDGDGRRGAFLVEADTLELAPQATLDLTRSLATISFDGAEARTLIEPGAADGTLDRAGAIAAALLAAESVGAAQRCLERSIEHARQRLQFGRPIGSFQAVRHRCARMLVEIELARALVERAVLATQDDAADQAIAADLALERATAAFEKVARDMIQVHGGIGFTWEHDAHLYLKRAASSRRVLDTPTARRGRLAAALGI